MKHHKRGNILIFGPQGSGKGTQADMLSQKLHIPHISPGAIYRQIQEENTDFGRLVANVLNQGKLMPDRYTNEIMGKRIKEQDCENGFILDGYPRNMEQTKYVLGAAPIDCVIVLTLSDAEGVRRIALRRTCPNGHSYHKIFAPPKTPNVCDRDGLPLATREDETEDAVRERLRIYHTETEPLIELFKERGVPIVEIDGEPPIEEVAQTIEKKLNLT